MNNDMMSGVGRCIALAALFGLVFFAASQPARAERKGAELRLIKSDGSQVQGELIAVRGETLVILGGALDVSVGFGEIGQITIVKKSYGVYGAGIGLLLGLVVGSTGGQRKPYEAFRQIRQAGVGGEVALLLGGLGFALGAVAGIDEKISLATPKTDREKAEILKRLTSLARINSAE